MAISSDIKREIGAYLHRWVEDLARKKKTEYAKYAATGIEPKGGHKPFHRALVPESVSRGSSLERSLSSGLGATYEHCAEVIACQRFNEVKRQHDLAGYVPANTLAEIDNIIHEINIGKRFSNYRHEVQRLVKLVRGDTSNSVSRDVRSDLYVSDSTGNEIYIEFKSPSPNKDQCLTTTRKHLTIHCIKQSSFPKVQTYFGMAYNPYGTHDYAYSFGCKYLDIKNHALIGKPLWELLGGPGTYEDLVDIYENVGITGGTKAIREAVDV